MFEWSDIRYLLAVVRTGSSLAAAAQVGSSQSTVTRRIDALESALGLKLFERRARGYFLTDQCRQLLPLFEAAALAMEKIDDASVLARRQLSGRIRMALPPDGGDPAIMGPIVDFMRLHPGVIVETVPAQAFEDVAAGDVDIAFRAGPCPDDPGLIVRKVGEIVWQPCCSVEYAEEHGVPASLADSGGHRMIGAEGQLAQAPPFQRFHELVGPCELRGVSIQALVGYVRVGAGISILPEVIIASNDEIVAYLPPLVEAPSEAWIITREDIRKTPHVRAFLDYMAEHLSTLLRREN